MGCERCWGMWEGFPCAGPCVRVGTGVCNEGRGLSHGTFRVCPGRGEPKRGPKAHLGALTHFFSPQVRGSQQPLRDFIPLLGKAI